MFRPKHQRYSSQDIYLQSINVFIKLVKKEYLDIYITAKQFNKQLGLDSITRGKIKGKIVLSIKIKPFQALYSIEEVEDSKKDSKKNSTNKSRVVDKYIKII